MTYDLLRYYYHEFKELFFDIRLYIKRYDSVKEKSFATHKPIIFIITAPEYGNIGDHAICKSMMDYAQKKFPNHQLYEIPDSEFEISVNWIIKNNKKEDYIWLIGGGNFGTLYILSEWNRRRIIKACKKATIIMFPQSSVWNDDLYSQLQLKRSSRIYSKNKNLFLMARDGNTFKLLNKYFKNMSFLVPDIVLTSYVDNSKCEDTILMCMRTDIEKSVNLRIQNEIEQFLVKRGYNIEKFDTETYSKIPREDSENKVKSTILKFSSARYVITDRLHGLIFAQITGTPCLAIDSVTKKISGLYSLWIDKEHNVLFDEKKSICLQVEKLLSYQKYNYSNYTSIAKIDDAINEIIRRIR